MLFALQLAAASQEGIPEAPDPPRLVNDFADILSSQEESRLEHDLVSFADSTSNQIVVVTVKDLGSYKPAEFTKALGNKWGVGQKEANNGIVIMIKPTGGAGERHTYIGTGYGLEGLLTDSICKQIVDQTMIPAFKRGHFYSGISQASGLIQQLISGEISADQFRKKRTPFPLWILVSGSLFLLPFLYGIWMECRGTRQYAATNDISFLEAFLITSVMGRHRGSWDDFQSGSGGFGGGGSSGGGFGGGGGGFGGGSFGGGGAGGSW